MPTYPTLPISKDSRRVVRDGREEDTLGDGTARVRKMHATRYDFEVTHPMLTSSEFTTWNSFFTTNENATTIDFTWPEDGATYQVRFGRGAWSTRWAAPGRRDVIVRLVSAA